MAENRIGENRVGIETGVGVLRQRPAGGGNQKRGGNQTASCDVHDTIQATMPGQHGRAA
jgi:hypothetical protein